MKAIKEMSIVKAFIKAWKNMRFSSADTAKYNCQMFFAGKGYFEVLETYRSYKER